MSRGIHRALDKNGPTGSSLGVNAHKPFDIFKLQINIRITRNLSSPAKDIDSSCNVFWDWSWHCSGMKESFIYFKYSLKLLKPKIGPGIINNVHAKQRGPVTSLFWNHRKVIFNCCVELQQS